MSIGFCSIIRCFQLFVGIYLDNILFRTLLYRHLILTFEHIQRHLLPEKLLSARSLVCVLYVLCQLLPIHLAPVGYAAVSPGIVVSQLLLSDDTVFRLKTPVVTPFLIGCQEVRCVMVPFNEPRTDNEICFKDIRIGEEISCAHGGTDVV